MKFSELMKRFAECYVDQHEDEICESIYEAMEMVIDVDDVATEVIDLLAAFDRSAVDLIVEEVMNRL